MRNLCQAIDHSGRGRSIVAVDRVRGEGGQADRDVLGAAGFRAAVAHPFARPGMYCLASPDRHLAALVVHDQGAVKHDCELIELGALPRLGPAGRAAHVRDTEPGIAGVGPAHVFLDQLRRFTRGGYLSRLANQFWHARQYPAGAGSALLAGDAAVLDPVEGLLLGGCVVGPPGDDLGQARVMTIRPSKNLSTPGLIRTRPQLPAVTFSIRSVSRARSSESGETR